MRASHHGLRHLGTNEQATNHTHDEKSRTSKEPRQTAVQIALRRLRRDAVTMMMMVMMVVMMAVLTLRFRRSGRRNMHWNEATARRAFAHDIAGRIGFHHRSRAAILTCDGIFHSFLLFVSSITCCKFSKKFPNHQPAERRKCALPDRKGPKRKNRNEAASRIGTCFNNYSGKATLFQGFFYNFAAPK